MQRLTLWTTACVVAVLAMLTSSIGAQSPDTNKRTFMTFSSAVELPGVTLEPGSYEFRLAPMSDSRDVVQVLKKDDTKVLGQWTFVQAERERATDDTVVMFKEAREGSTPAIQYWYYPGEKVGREFIYPKDQAQRIASRTGQTVRSEGGPVTPATADAGITANSDRVASADTGSDRRDAAADSALRNGPVAAQPSAPAGSLAGNRGTPAQPDASAAASTDNSASSSSSTASASADTTLRDAPVATQPSAPAGSLSGNRGAVGTSGDQQGDRAVGTSGVAQAPAAPAPAAQPAPRAGQSTSRPAPANELPKTASELPLSGLIGALSLVAALGLRAVRA
jgi:hypothetical protein